MPGNGVTDNYYEKCNTNRRNKINEPGVTGVRSVGP